MRDGGFEQAAIRIENEKEFEELKDAVNRAFGSQRVEGWLTRVRTSGVAWDLGKMGAQSLYPALTVSDQTQLREFYLSKVEEVEPGLRFQQLYRDY